MSLHPKLDNPVWYALTETHREYVVDYDGVKFYHPDYCPFGGFINSDKTASAIAAYSEHNKDFFIVGDKPKHNDTVQLKRELVCNQMVLEHAMNVSIQEQIVELQEQHREQLFQLVNKIQPGYFRRDTARLGKYVGIFNNDQLIAAAGERMKMNGYTEVSAVVTDPAHTGKGLASQLMALVSNRIFAEGKIPFLHVVESNTGAIRLYEKLGFVNRRKMSLWNFVKTENE